MDKARAEELRSLVTPHLNPGEAVTVIVEDGEEANWSTANATRVVMILTRVLDSIREN